MNPKKHRSLIERGNAITKLTRLRQMHGFDLNTPISQLPVLPNTILPQLSENHFLELPTNEHPVFIGIAKRSQIAGIPKDRYAVSVIASLKSPHQINPVGEDDNELVIAISYINKGYGMLKKHQKKQRVQKRINGMAQPSYHIFNPPVDEDKLAECIFDVMDGFFHDEETCTICNMKYNRMEFCVLVQLFFKYIGFLKVESRLAFSTYLQKKVFETKSEFGIRTYNTYANKDIFQRFDEDLKNIKVDFKRHPKYPPESNENILKLVFQEIGWAFQHSDYFIELRELRKTMETFNL